ncbi:hypothetical protein CY35_06G080000 [Sphagnum magellanicum]|nr:hypothetical protein CY35_06G080000 [Sphagnum magellanicum]
MHLLTSGCTKQGFLSGPGYTDLRLQIEMLPNMVTQFSLSIDLVKFYGLEANLSCVTDQSYWSYLRCMMTNKLLGAIAILISAHLIIGHYKILRFYSCA